MKILIKAMRPHRQKVLTEGGEEMRLQQWANKQAASALREAGGDEGKLSDGTKPEEEEEEFEPDKEAEHLRRIMTSRQVPMRDAWSILKS